MSSPLGGFYISKLNRQQKEKFELAKQTQIKLQVTLEINGSIILTETLEMVIGKVVTINATNCSIDIYTAILPSGLLNVSCSIAGFHCSAKQEFNLSPNESLSSLVAVNEEIKLTLCASKNS